MDSGFSGSTDRTDYHETENRDDKESKDGKSTQPTVEVSSSSEDALTATAATTVETAIEAPLIEETVAPVAPTIIHIANPAVSAVCNVLMADSSLKEQPWHSQKDHTKIREVMEQCISHLITQRRPTASSEWTQKLPEVVKRVERNLYYAARSIEQYSDPFTVVDRIQNLVKNLVVAASTVTPKIENISNSSSEGTSSSSDSSILNTTTNAGAGSYIAAIIMSPPVEQCSSKSDEAEDHKRKLSSPSPHNQSRESASSSSCDSSFREGLFEAAQRYQKVQLETAAASSQHSTAAAVDSEADSRSLHLHALYCQQQQQQQLLELQLQQQQKQQLLQLQYQHQQNAVPMRRSSFYDVNPAAAAANVATEYRDAGLSPLLSAADVTAPSRDSDHDYLLHPAQYLLSSTADTAAATGATYLYPYPASHHSAAVAAAAVYSTESVTPHLADAAAVLGGATSFTRKLARSNNTNNNSSNNSSSSGHQLEFINSESTGSVGNNQDRSQRILALSRQVSSQGCSRVFIVKVLRSVGNFVRGKSMPSIFTFKRELVMSWLLDAKRQCGRLSYTQEELLFGGPPFVEDDVSTHWSEPHQLYTWWKNNVERRSKYKVLQEDAKYQGLCPRRQQRSRWCEAVVALAEEIRASSGSSSGSRLLGGISRSDSNSSSNLTARSGEVSSRLTNTSAAAIATTAATIATATAPAAVSDDAISMGQDIEREAGLLSAPRLATRHSSDSLESAAAEAESLDAAALDVEKLRLQKLAVAALAARQASGTRIQEPFHSSGSIQREYDTATSTAANAADSHYGRYFLLQSNPQKYNAATASAVALNDILDSSHVLSTGNRFAVASSAASADVPTEGELLNASDVLSSVGTDGSRHHPLEHFIRGVKGFKDLTFPDGFAYNKISSGGSSSNDNSSSSGSISSHNNNAGLSSFLLTLANAASAPNTSESTAAAVAVPLLPAVPTSTRRHSIGDNKYSTGIDGTDFLSASSSRGPLISQGLTRNSTSTDALAAVVAASFNTSQQQQKQTDSGQQRGLLSERDAVDPMQYSFIDLPASSRPLSSNTNGHEVYSTFIDTSNAVLKNNKLDSKLPAVVASAGSNVINPQQHQQLHQQLNQHQQQLHQSQQQQQASKSGTVSTLTFRSTFGNTFPLKLYELVNIEDPAIVGWQLNGMAFQVRDMEKFVNHVLPKHFKHTNYTSFQRQLNLYGFRRSASYDKGSYYHPMFVQGKRELVEAIRRVITSQQQYLNSNSSIRSAAATATSDGGGAATGAATAHAHGSHSFKLQQQFRESYGRDDYSSSIRNSTANAGTADDYSMRMSFHPEHLASNQSQSTYYGRAAVSPPLEATTEQRDSFNAHQLYNNSFDDSFLGGSSATDTATAALLALASVATQACESMNDSSYDQNYEWQQHLQQQQQQQASFADYYSVVSNVPAATNLTLPSLLPSITSDNAVFPATTTTAAASGSNSGGKRSRIHSTSSLVATADEDFNELQEPVRKRAGRIEKLRSSSNSNSNSDDKLIVGAVCDSVSSSTIQQAMIRINGAEAQFIPNFSSVAATAVATAAAAHSSTAADYKSAAALSAASDSRRRRIDAVADDSNCSFDSDVETLDETKFKVPHERTTKSKKHNNSKLNHLRLFGKRQELLLNSKSQKQCSGSTSVKRESSSDKSKSCRSRCRSWLRSGKSTAAAAFIDSSVDQGSSSDSISEPPRKQQRRRTHAVSVAAEVADDFIDLSAPSRRRIMLDLTILDTTTDGSNNNSNSRVVALSNQCDYVHGVFYGVVRLGSADRKLHLQHLGSNAIPDYLLTDTTEEEEEHVDHAVGDNSHQLCDQRKHCATDSNDGSSGLRCNSLQHSLNRCNNNNSNNNNNNNSSGSRKERCHGSRVGEEFQVDFTSLGNIIDISAPEANMSKSVWSPHWIAEEKLLNQFLEHVQYRIQDLFVTEGAIAVCYLPPVSCQTYRLCCVLQQLSVSFAQYQQQHYTTAAVVTEQCNCPLSSAEASSRAVRIFDGITEWIVPLLWLQLPRPSGEQEALMRAFVAHSGCCCINDDSTDAVTAAVAVNAAAANTATAVPIGAATIKDIAVASNDAAILWRAVDQQLKAAGALFADWTAADVQCFCANVHRSGGPSMRLAQMFQHNSSDSSSSNNNNRSSNSNNISRSRSFAELLEFHRVVYPHVRVGGGRRLVDIFHRAERARTGQPDCSSDDSSSCDENSNSDNNRRSSSSDGR